MAETDRLAPFLRLLACMGLACCLAGCVLGPIEAAEEEALYAPTIVLDELYPPAMGITSVRREDCARITFKSGFVNDRNIDDVLYVWWVLDYNEGAGDISTQAVKEAFIGKMGSVERFGRQLEYTLSLSQPDTFFSQTHTMTLIVRDRTIEDEEGQEDRVQWTFQVVAGGTYCDE